MLNPSARRGAKMVQGGEKNSRGGSFPPCPHTSRAYGFLRFKFNNFLKILFLPLQINLFVEKWQIMCRKNQKCK